MIWNPNLTVRESGIPIRFLLAGSEGGVGWYPAEVLTETEDVRVDCEGGTLHAEESDAGGCFDADAGVLDEGGEGVFGG